MTGQASSFKKIIRPFFVLFDYFRIFVFSACYSIVIPAQAGIYMKWIPVFTGMTKKIF